MVERTIYQMFLETVQAHGEGNAVGFRPNKGAEYTYWTYRALNDKVRAFARGLDALGLRKGERIALISHDNRVEWAITDLAAQYLGLVTVPIYGTLPVRPSRLLHEGFGRAGYPRRGCPNSAPK